MTPSEKPLRPGRSALASEIAVRLRELRARFNLKQDEVARRIGCHESAISRWESASRLPSCQDLIELARVYEVSCDTLLGIDEIPLPRGIAVLDAGLLARLRDAGSTEEFDRIVRSRADHAVWIPVEEGAVAVPVAEAMRRASTIAALYPESRHAGLLFRTRAASVDS